MGRSLSSSSGKPRATTRVVRRHERSVFRTGTLGTLYQRRLTNRVLRAAAAVVLPSSSKYTSPLQFVLIGGKSLLLTMRLSSYPAPLLYYVVLSTTSVMLCSNECQETGCFCAVTSQNSCNYVLVRIYYVVLSTTAVTLLKRVSGDWMFLRDHLKNSCYYILVRRRMIYRRIYRSGEVSQCTWS